MSATTIPADCSDRVAVRALSDFRLPDTLRTGVASLYTGFADVWRAVDIPTDLMTTGVRDRPAHHVPDAIT